MFTVRQALFNTDGSGGGKPWDGVYPSSYVSEQSYAAPVDDVQPEGDTDTEVLEEGEEVTEESTDDVTDDETQDVEESEETDEVEETEEQPVVDEDPEIELGDGKKPVKLSELKNGFMRQSDYTKKTQEIATQRKEVETLRDSLKQTESFQKHLESNPWVWQQINSALDVFNTSGVLPIEEALQDAQYGHYINHLMSENATLKKEMGTLKGDYEGVKLTSEINNLRSELKGEYGDLVTDSYVETLQERAKSEGLSATTLKEIADGHFAKEMLKNNQQNVKKVSKEAEAKAIQKLQETRKQAPTSPKTTTSTPSKNNTPSANRDWGDFFRSLVD